MPFDVGLMPKLHTQQSVFLLRAAEIISRRRDWNIGQENGRSRWGRTTYCAVGAVRRALEVYDLDQEEDDIVELLDRAARKHGFECVVALNDHPDTTHAMIMQVFHEAAEMAMTDSVT